MENPRLEKLTDIQKRRQEKIERAKELFRTTDMIQIDVNAKLTEEFGSRLDMTTISEIYNEIRPKKISKAEAKSICDLFTKALDIPEFMALVTEDVSNAITKLEKLK